MRKFGASPAVVVMMVAVGFGCAGCGDKNEKDQFKVDTRAMVPAATTPADTTPADTAAADSLAHESIDGAGVGARPDELKPAGTPAEPARQVPVSAKVAPVVGTFNLQLGSFRSAENAMALADRVRAMGQNPYVEVATLGGQTYHRVVLRGLKDRNQAERLGESLRGSLGITYLIRQN
jgi:cell division septation protein DedD